MLYHFFYNIYTRLIEIGNFLQSFVLLAMRLFWGYFFFETGSGKLQDIGEVAGFFQGLGIPLPTFNAYLVGGIEAVCGLCLMLGFASRLITLPLICVMVGAYLTAEMDSVRNIFTNTENFIKQTPFTYLLTSLIVFVFGPGKISIDYLLEKFVFKPK